MSNPTLARTAPRTLPAAAASVAATAAVQPAQYLTFTLGGETFAIGILAIKEIIEHRTPTEVPMGPPSVRGVINLRGAVVPVMDLQARFGHAASTVGKRTCIVIVEFVHAGDSQVIGVLVDAVNEVLDIPGTDIEPPPNFGSRIRSDFIAGMGKVRGRFVILLDVGRVLAVEELAAVGGPGAPLAPSLSVAH